MSHRLRVRVLVLVLVRYRGYGAEAATVLFYSAAIVVSSLYHMRRAAWLFDRVLWNDNITLMYSPVENSWFEPEQ